MENRELQNCSLCDIYAGKLYFLKLPATATCNRQCFTSPGHLECLDTNVGVITHKVAKPNRVINYF